MKLHAVLGAGVLASLTSIGTVTAETNGVPEPESTSTVRLKLPVGPTMADIAPVDLAHAGGAPGSRLVYLNKCEGNCVVRAGFESSINNTSSIISGTRTIQEFAYSDSVWQAVVACVRETYAPFNISITDQDPGSVNHWEAIVAGEPQQAGFSSGVGGVSPWDPVNCSIINNSITYSFANIYGPDVNQICWTVAQEVAHSFGLDHEYLREDPMTYLSGSSLPGGVKRFQDVNAQCGEFSPRQCECSQTQNSVQKILSIFGSATPTPPVITFDSPTNGQSVSPGFSVRVSIADDNGVADVTLVVDGQTIDTISTSPYVFNTPETLSEGTHTLVVRATDNQGTEGSAQISVNIGPPCETPGDCAAQGDNLTCVGGRCVPGEGADGGLGDTCMEDSECFSGRCETATTGESYCVEACTPGSSDCPGGFQCISAGVCWPGDDDGGFFGCSTGDDGRVPTLPIALGAALGALVLRRRRRA